MSKKIQALILGLVFVLSLCPMTTLANQSAALTLNTDGSIATYGKNVDDFEHLELQPNRKISYPDSSLGQTSNVFQAKADAGSGEFTIEEAVGGRTGKMLKINPAEYASLYIWKLPLPAGHITRFAFDFYFDTFDQDVAGVRFGGNIGNGVTHDVLKSFVQEKTWYRYVVEIDANQKSRTAFLDDEGNIVYCQATRRGPSGGTSGYDYTSGWPVTEGTSDTWINGTEPVIYISTPGSFIVYVDNAEISAYKATEWDAPSLLSSTIADDATEVSSVTSEVTLAFDQPLTSTTATLTPNGGQGVTCTAQLIGGVGTKEHTYKLALPALTADTQYTLSLNGFSNGGKTCTDVITFTTAGGPIVISHDVESTEVARNAEFTFNFDQPVSGTITLKEKISGNPVVTTTTPLATDELKLSWTGLLEKGVDYEISFENVTNGTLACATTPITFKTENLHLWNDINISPVSAGNGEMSISFNISDEFDYLIFTGSVLVAAYHNDSLIGVDMVALTNEDTTQTITKTVNIGNLPQGATLEITLLDVDYGAVPLAIGATTVQ